MGWHLEGLSFIVVFSNVPNGCRLRSRTDIPACIAWMKKPLTFFSGLVPRIVTENKLPHDKTNKMACAPIEDSDQPGHPPSLIRDFPERMKKAWVLSYPLSAH